MPNPVETPEAIARRAEYMAKLPPKTVVVLSGGVDSSVLLAQAVHRAKRLAATCGRPYGDDEVAAISFDYGQRHHIELVSASQQAAAQGVEHRTVSIIGIGELLAGSSQTDLSVEVPEGAYDGETMKATVVPNRNMIMLAIAGAWIASRGGGRVAYGAHGGDHAIYPDCRPEFIDPLGEAFRRCDWNPVTLWAPFKHWSKAKIVNLGASLGVDWSKTWTCYKGGDMHCGRCGACNERLEAFSVAGVVDKVEFERR